MIKGARFHHVGYAVSDIDAATAALTLLGFTPSLHFHDCEDRLQNVRLRFLVNPDSLLFELVAGLPEHSPVDSWLQKFGATVYHTCFEIDDIAASTPELKSAGYRPLTRPMTATAFDQRLIQFFHHRHLGVVEFLNAP